MQEEVARLTCKLARSSSKAVNLRQLLNVCTTNALTRIMIGRRIFNDDSSGCDPKADEFKSMVGELMTLFGVFNIGDFIPALDWLDLQGVKAKTKKLHKKVDAFLTTILEEHKSFENDKHQGLLSALLSLTKDPQEGHTIVEPEIKAILAVCTFLRFNNSKSLNIFCSYLN